MGKQKAIETGGAGLPMVAGVERLRRACDILSCDFTVAFNACENDILTRGDVAAKLCEILTCEASFDDGGIDRELRRIAPFAIAEQRERINDAFGLHKDAPEITESDISLSKIESLKDVCCGLKDNTQKAQLLDVAIRIIAADNKVLDEEINFLKSVMAELSVNHDKVNSLIEYTKHMAVNNHEFESIQENLFVD